MINYHSVISVGLNKDLVELCSALKKNKNKVFIIDGELINDGLSFFHNAVNLPLDPPLVAAKRLNIDALLDSLRGGIWNLTETNEVSKIVFIWSHVENIYQNTFDDLYRIINAFQELAKNLDEPEYKMPNAVELSVCLLVDEEFYLTLKENLQIH